MSSINAPWRSCYGVVKPNLEYPQCAMWQMVERAAKSYPELLSYDFLGTTCTYKKLMRDIRLCARGLKAMGIKENDRVTVCMPNSPQAVVFLYAINMVGAVANMIHPLSSEKEIEFYLRDSKSVAALTLDQFYSKFARIRREVHLPKLVITSVKDALNPLMKLGFALTEGRKTEKPPKDADVILWQSFLQTARAYEGEYVSERAASHPAVILYSGGTTGITKGILLSNLNFNALAMQIDEMSNCLAPGKSMLAIMPMFHGFGLGVCIHSMLAGGCKCILVPRFTPKTYAQLLKKRRPNYIAGVPSLYETLLRNPDMNGVDLSCLMGVFSGGDSLSIELKKRFDKFLKEHNAGIEIREGYGTTECVTASCLTPYNMSREGSIGVPFPDTYYKIVAVGSEDAVPCGVEGEITLCGPSVMIEYVNQPEETAHVLRVHADGRVWLHTGDLGVMDEDGFIYFRQRIKRMIVTNGYNVYPSHLENILDAHEYVQMSCVIGVPDPVKMQKVKAFVMLRPGIPGDAQTSRELFAHCKKHIAKYAMPYDIEIRDQLPKTLVGKVAFRELEREELEKTADSSTM